MSVTQMDKQKRSAKDIFNKVANLSPKSFLIIYRDEDTEDKDLVVINQTIDHVEMVGMFEYSKMVMVNGDMYE